MELCSCLSARGHRRTCSSCKVAAGPGNTGGGGELPPPTHCGTISEPADAESLIQDGKTTGSPRVIAQANFALLADRFTAMR
eukprot:scaffold14896_cov111-Isochrysis_galbana.AAC.8